MTGYVVLLVVSVLFCAVVRVVAIPVPIRRGGRQTLHPVEIAYLVGGAEHALLVAGLGLYERGLLRPTTAVSPAVGMSRVEALQRAASHCVVDEVPPGGHPLEQAVAVALITEAQRPVLDEGLRRGAEMTAVRGHLVSLGLVVDDAMAWWVRLGYLQLAVVAGLGAGLAAGSWTGGGRWGLAGALVLVTVTATALAVRVRERRATSRIVGRARAPHHEVAESLRQRIANVGYGTNDPELRRVGTDPAVVAAHGPEVIWSAEPLLAIALGAIPSKARSSHDQLHDAPLHSQTGWHGV